MGGSKFQLWATPPQGQVNVLLAPIHKSQTGYLHGHGFGLI
jgi:hypothetical protein